MVAGGEFASIRLTQHHAIPEYDGSDLGRGTSWLAYALPREFDGLLHKRSLYARTQP